LSTHRSHAIVHAIVLDCPVRDTYPTPILANRYRILCSQALIRLLVSSVVLSHVW